MAQESTYLALVEEVHSGDDMILLVDLGVDGLYKRVRARLKGVDTPSAFKAKPDTEGGKIRDFVKDLLEGNKCSIVLHSCGKGGWMVTVMANVRNASREMERVNLNEMLISQGYVYSGNQGLE